MLQLERIKMLDLTDRGYELKSDAVLIYNKERFEKALSKFANNEIIGTQYEFHYEGYSINNDNVALKAKCFIEDDGIYTEAILFDTPIGNSIQKQLTSPTYGSCMGYVFIPVCKGQCSKTENEVTNVEEIFVDADEIISIDILLTQNLK